MTKDNSVDDLEAQVAAEANDGFVLDETPTTGLPDIKEMVSHLVAIRPLYWAEHQSPKGPFKGLHCEVIDTDDDSGTPVFYDDVMVSWKGVVLQLVGKDNDPDDHPAGPDGATTKWRSGTLVRFKSRGNDPVRLESPSPAGLRRVQAAGAAWKRGELKTIKRPKDF
jgi:hypothetical protein